MRLPTGLAFSSSAPFLPSCFWSSAVHCKHSALAASYSLVVTSALRGPRLVYARTPGPWHPILARPTRLPSYTRFLSSSRFNHSSYFPPSPLVARPSPERGLDPFLLVLRYAVTGPSPNSIS